MHKSFQSALAEQALLTRFMLEEDQAPPLREAARAREMEAVVEPEKVLEFNNTLSKLVKNLKKDAGAKSIKQNYRGTGKQKARRQLYIHFKNGAVLDIWLDMGYVGLGGVVGIRPDGSRGFPVPHKIDYGDKSPYEVYREVKDALKKWMA